MKFVLLPTSQTRNISLEFIFIIKNKQANKQTNIDVSVIKNLCPFKIMNAQSFKYVVE